jgi:hypothetical protein
MPMVSKFGGKRSGAKSSKKTITLDSIYQSNSSPFPPPKITTINAIAIIVVI